MTRRWRAVLGVLLWPLSTVTRRGCGIMRCWSGRRITMLDSYTLSHVSFPRMRSVYTRTLNIGSQTLTRQSPAALEWDICGISTATGDQVIKSVMSGCFSRHSTYKAVDSIDIHSWATMTLLLLLLDRPFCQRSILCFAHVFFPNSLFPTSANRYFRNFSTWRGFTRKRSAAMPIF